MTTRSHQFKPVARVPNKRDLEIARAEFERREAALEPVRENERDVRIVLATGVKLHKWMDSTMANRKQSFRFEAVVEEGVRAEDINADFQYRHQVRYCYCQSKWYAPKLGRGMELFTIDAAGNTSLREPDLSFAKIGGHTSTLIAEVEECHRSVVSLDQWCRGYFYTPGVRLVVGLKLYPPILDGNAAALALQYGYN
ncbi:hypothetical protein Ae201684P_012875 [Aphanomyces euteiches]|nr:hypothetical protein Ae201684P_012875 [Aphanomyces euteiches]